MTVGSLGRDTPERPPRFYASPEEDVDRVYGDLVDVHPVETDSTYGISLWFESAKPFLVTFEKGGLR